MLEGGLGPVELVTILAIAVIVFGPKRFSGFGGGPSSGNDPKGGRPQHPLPVTGPVEKTPQQKDQTEAEAPDRAQYSRK
jgi:hypothetical protein